MSDTKSSILTLDDVKHVAQLANLDLNSNELNKFRLQLSEILNYVKQLQAVNTEGVDETSQVTGLTNVLREDATTDSFAVEEALANAKQTHNGYVKVPGILENS